MLICVYSGAQIFITNKADSYHCFDTHDHYHHPLYFPTAYPINVYSRLWFHFMLTTLWNRKEKSKIDENYSDPHSTDGENHPTPREKQLFQAHPVSEQVVWPLGYCSALTTWSSHIWVTLNADNMRPYMFLIPLSLRGHKLTITKWGIASRGYWWDFKME